MDEERLREMLRNATSEEPPIGPIALNALRAGLRLRRRRRIQGASTCAAAVLAIGIAVPAATGPHQHGQAVGGHRHGQVLYAIGTGRYLNWVTPISVRTNRVGRPIMVTSGSSTSRAVEEAVLSPDGRKLYVLDGARSALVPVSTRRGAAGKPIHIGGSLLCQPIPNAACWPTIAITPTGKTVYVAHFDTSGGVTPVSTATDVAGRLIPASGYAGIVAVDPNGRTAYVLTEHGVTPIRVATGKPGKLIRLGGPPEAIVITPDGRTAYVYAAGRVTPIATATNRPGRPVTITGTLARLAITPNGRTLLVASAHFLRWPKYSTITPVATPTGRAGKPVRVHGTVYSITMAPDGKVAYIGDSQGVVPLTIATDSLGKTVPVPGGPIAVVITANGKTVYVLSNDTVIPVRTATDTAGRPIKLTGIPESLVLGP